MSVFQEFYTGYTGSTNYNVTTKTDASFSKIL